MCPEKNELMAHFDGELPPEKSLQLNAHVVDCESCKALILEWRGITSLMGAMRCPEPPAGVLLRLGRHAAALPELELRRMGSIFAGLAATLLVGASLVSYRLGNTDSVSGAQVPSSRWEMSAVSGHAIVNDAGQPKLADWMSFGVTPTRN